MTREPNIAQGHSSDPHGPPASGPGVAGPRQIALEGGCNFRDIGGYRTRDGRSVRWGRIYRSGVLSYLTAGDALRLNPSPGQAARERFQRGHIDIMTPLTIKTFHVFDAPAEKVWALLADFGAIERWWPTEGPHVIERVELEGQGLGMVRHIFNRGARHRVSERLERLEPDERLLQLSILGRDPTQTPWYHATARLLELPDGRCRLDYESEFSAPRGRENQTRDGILAAYRAMFSGLQSSVG